MGRRTAGNKTELFFWDEFPLLYKLHEFVQKDSLVDLPQRTEEANRSPILRELGIFPRIGNCDYLRFLAI